MKRKILLIHNGYPLGEEVGDKVRVLNMASIFAEDWIESLFFSIL